MQYIYGIHAVEALLKDKTKNVNNLFVQSGRTARRLQNILTSAHERKIKIQIIAKEKLDAMTDQNRHQGVVAVIADKARPYKMADLDSLLEQLQEPPFLLILDGVQDPHNLGACLRSADAAGIHAVIIPKDRAVGMTPIVRKVACGAAESVPVTQVTNLARTLQSLKERGVWLYGAAAEARKNIYDIDLKGPIALILGAEDKGLRRLTRENCDALMSIPMLGSVNSLNVSVACGVCLFEAVRQRTIK